MQVECVNLGALGPFGRRVVSTSGELPFPDTVSSQRVGSKAAGSKADPWMENGTGGTEGAVVARDGATHAPRAAGQFTESSGEIKFPEISTPILEKVIQYFYYKLRYTNSQVRIPEFQIDPEMALELLMASNFLDC